MENLTQRKDRSILGLRNEPFEPPINKVLEGFVTPSIYGASTQEIIGFLKRRKGQAGKIRKKVGLEPTDKGQCMGVSEVADQFGGQVFLSSQMRVHPDQRSPGHAVAVIPTNQPGKGGIVVDRTDRRNVIGQVTDVTDKGRTKDELQQITGSEGWREW